MSSPEVDEILFAYLVVVSHAVSFVLIQVDGGIQRPVYYVSKSLHVAKVRYLSLEKAILAIVHATWKLPSLFSGAHYGCSNSITVQINTSGRRLYRRIAK